MSEDDIGSRFKDKPIKTYSRSKPAGSGSVKAGMSVSKWGNANFMPIRGDEASDAKKIKIEMQVEDPFSFDPVDQKKKTSAGDVPKEKVLYPSSSSFSHDDDVNLDQILDWELEFPSGNSQLGKFSN